MKSLEQYRLFLEKVDSFATTVTTRFPEQVACRRGCDACCTHIGVMAVEAIAISLAVAALPKGEAENLRSRARRMQREKTCPLLEGGSCLIYGARPVICRTHGLPLLVEENGQRRVDHCPLNFTGVDSLPGNTVLNLETLNQTLTAINLLFLSELDDAASLPAERLSLADAVLLKLPGHE